MKSDQSNPKKNSKKTMNHQLKVLFTGVDFCSSNRGVAALSYGSLICLLNKNENLRIGVWNTMGFTKNCKKVQEVTLIKTKVPLCETNIFTTLYILFLSFLFRGFPKFFKRFLLSLSPYLREFIDYDLIIDLSYGDSFSDFYTWKRAVLNSLTKFIPYNLGKTIYMFPQTIGPFRTKFGLKLCQVAINLAEKVYVREVISYQVAQKLLKDKSKLFLKTDMSFLLASDENYEVNFLSKSYRYIGINISGLLYDEKRRYKLLRKDFDYRGLLFKLTKFFLSQENTRIVFIPHAYDFYGNNPKFDDDLKAIKKFITILPGEFRENINVINEDLSCGELKKIISSMNFFIGSRMHACIAALSSNVPSALISYSYKFRGILEKMRITEIECNPEKISEDQIIQKINAIYSRREEIKNKLIESNKRMKKSAYSCGDILN